MESRVRCQNGVLQPMVRRPTAREELLKITTREVCCWEIEIGDTEPSPLLGAFG